MIRRLFARTQGEGGGEGGAPGAGAGAGAGAGGGEEPKKARAHESTVAFERFDEVRRELRAVKAEAAKSAEYRTSLDAVTAELAGLKAAAAQKDEALGLARVGVVDEDHVEALRLVHARLPEADRPTLADYARTIAEATERPKLLAGFYTAPATTTTTGRPGPKLPTTPAGGPPADVGKLATDIRAARERLQASPTADNRKALTELLARARS